MRPIQVDVKRGFAPIRVAVEAVAAAAAVEMTRPK